MAIINLTLSAALFKHGLVPAHCRLLEVVIPAGNPPLIRYEKFLDETECEAFAEALMEVVEEAREARKAQPPEQEA